MREHSTTPLTLAAAMLDSHPAALRKTLNQFQIVERDGLQRAVPNDILALFRRTKALCGYLYPHWVRSHDDLLAAAAKIPASEIDDLARAVMTLRTTDSQNPKSESDAATVADAQEAADGE